MRAAGSLLLSCALLAALPAIAVRAVTRVHGIEADATEAQDRLLVFADGELVWRIERDDARTTHLVIRDAVLDPSTPRRVVARRGSAWSLATVVEEPGPVAEIRITLQHAPGATGDVSKRGTQLAYAFDRRKPQRENAQRPAPKLQEPTLRVRQINGDLRDMIVRLARFVDMQILFDESLSGRVSIDAPEPITRAEAVALIDTLLLLKGFAALPTPGGVHKIVPLAGAQGVFVPELGDDPGQTLVTTIVLLHDIDADLVEQAIRPLVGTSSVLLQHPTANGLILGGPGHRLSRLIEIVREIDELGPTRLVILSLEHASAVETAIAIEEAFEGRQLEVWPDERTHRLVVRGRPDRVEAVRAFVTRLDRPAQGHGEIQVLPVRYGDAARFAELLMSMRDGGESGAGDAPATVRGARSLAGRDFSVSVHAPTHSLVVRGDPSTIDLMREVLGELDRIPARIDVEVTVTEIAIDSSLALGFDAILPVTNPKTLSDLIGVIVTNPSAAISDVNPLFDPPESSLFAKIARTPLVVPILDPLTGAIIPLQIPRDTFAITADDRLVRSKVLLRPSLSLLSGEVHEIFAGDNIPVPTAEAGATNALEIRQNIERQDVGTRLRVEPTVGTEGGVVLKLDLEISRVTASVQNVREVGPTIRERTIESTIRLESGQYGVVAFAMTPTSLDVESGTPFLKDIPILGWFFRASRSVRLDTYLLVVARAEVYRPESEALSDWLRRKLEAESREVAEAPPS